MDALQQQIAESIRLLEERQIRLRKVADAARRAEDTSFDLRLDGLDPYACFRRNLAAFASYMPDVYAAFADYLPSKFDAVKMNSGEFNVLEIQSDTFLYGENARQMLAEQYISFRSEPTMSYYDVDPGQMEVDFIHVAQMRKLRQHMTELYSQDNPKNHFPEAIKSLMIFGVGIGYHIEWIVRDCKIRNLYIFEPEMDLFFSSLFTIDWDFILRKIDADGGAIHLSIDLNAKDHFGDLQRRMTARGQYDASFTYFMVHYRSERMVEVIDEVMAQFERLVFGYGFFDDALMSISHQMSSLRCQIPFFGAKTDQIDLTPVFLIANGPSLDDSIDVIRKYRSQAIVVSLSSAITALHRHGIVPDVHFEMERSRIVRTVLDTLNDAEYLRKIPLVALNTVHPEVFDLFDHSYIYAKANEAGSNLLRSTDGVPPFDLAGFCNPTVANMGLCVMAALGYRQIYLFGTDMGFPGDRHHASKSVYYDAQGDDKKLFEIKKSNLRKVAGNFGGELFTDQIFWQSARVLALEIELHPDIKVYNTAKGASIAHTIPLAISDVDPQPSELTPAESLQEKFARTFIVPEFAVDAMTARLKAGRFDQLLDELIAVIRTPAATRYDLMLRVDEQFERLHALEAGADLWLTDMLRGSLLYIHTLTQKGIMLPAEAEQAIAKYDQLCVAIVDYLNACRQRFHERMDVPDLTDLSHIWR